MAPMTVCGTKKIPFKDLHPGGAMLVLCPPRDHHKVRNSATGFGKRLDRTFTVAVIANGLMVTRTK